MRLKTFFVLPILPPCRIGTFSLFHIGTKMTSSEMPDFLKQKEKFLNMSIEERRKRYRNDVIAFKDIDTWNEYYNKNKERLKQPNYVRNFHVEPSPCVPQLNEKVSIWKGDITKLEIDVIVNAANGSLLGGGGVDGAIHRAAGEDLVAECKTLKGCDVGDAKITGGYQLPAKYVIHAVGPHTEEPHFLESCYKKSLKLLLENKLKSIAFPCISTGAYGFPQGPAANIAIKCVRDFLEKNESQVERVVFCLFLHKDVDIYENLMQSYFPVE